MIFVNRAPLILGRRRLSRSLNVIFSAGNDSFERISGRCFAKGEVGLVFEQPRGAVLRCHLSLDMATVIEYTETSFST